MRKGDKNTSKKTETKKDNSKIKPAKQKATEKICCPEFDPTPWDKKEIKWKDKFFVKDTIISAFHIPLNFGKIMKKNMKKIDEAKAATQRPIVLVDEINPFLSHLYIDVTKPVIGCHDVKLTGNFLSRAFEGPYKNMKKYIKEMKAYAKEKGKETKRNYFFYPTCPKCSKKYGKNYTVILSEF